MSSDIPGPALGGVEGDHAERVRILPAQQIADDRLPVRFGNVGLHEGAAERAEIIDHQVDGDVVRILTWGRDMVRDSQEPELNARPP
jgi:hypothetical protein